MDRLPEFDPAAGEVTDAELSLTDDVLVKAFALGPGATLEPHEHAGSTNVFHVLDGAVTVLREADSERVVAPGVVLNERGVVHGARNEGDRPAVLTASLCPPPG